MADASSAAAGNGWQGGVEALRQGQVAEAVAQLAEFVKAHPDSFEGHNFLGVALAQGGRNPEAISCLLKATRLNPQNAQAHYNLGRVYVRAERPDRAREVFQTALQLDPNYAAAQQALAALPVPQAAAPVGAVPLTTPASNAPVSATRPQAQLPAAVSPFATTTAAASPFDSTPVAATSGSQAAPARTDTTKTPPSGLAKIRDALSPANAAEATDGATATDLAKAFGLGTVAAIIGAALWYGFVMVTHRQWGLVAAGVGILVGLGVQMGASGKNGMSVALMGAVLAAVAMMGGEVLIINSVAREMGLDIQMNSLTDVFTVDPIFTIFFGIGVWRAWQTNAE
jgi:hypothetical protein